MLDFICWGCLLTIRSQHYCHRRIIFYRENPTGTCGESYLAHWYHLKTPSCEGVVVDVSQIYMPGGHEITLVKSLPDEIIIKCANIYSRGAGSERKCWKMLSRLLIQLEVWEFETKLNFTYDEPVWKIAAKAGHKTASHGPGLVFDFDSFSSRCQLLLNQKLPSNYWGLRWHLQEKIHVPMFKQIIRLMYNVTTD